MRHLLNNLIIICRRMHLNLDRTILILTIKVGIAQHSNHKRRRRDVCHVVVASFGVHPDGMAGRRGSSVCARKERRSSASLATFEKKKLTTLLEHLEHEPGDVVCVPSRVRGTAQRRTHDRTVLGVDDEGRMQIESAAALGFDDGRVLNRQDRASCATRRESRKAPLFSSRASPKRPSVVRPSNSFKRNQTPKPHTTKICECGRS